MEMTIRAFEIAIEMLIREGALSSGQTALNFGITWQPIRETVHTVRPLPNAVV